jgi:hypothetical protein
LNAIQKKLQIKFISNVMEINSKTQTYNSTWDLFQMKFHSIKDYWKRNAIKCQLQVKLKTLLIEQWDTVKLILLGKIPNYRYLLLWKRKIGEKWLNSNLIKLIGRLI